MFLSNEIHVTFENEEKRNGWIWLIMMAINEKKRIFVDVGLTMVFPL